LSLGANDLNEALIIAAKEGNIDLINYLISLGTVVLDEAWYIAIDYDQFRTVKYLLTQMMNLRKQDPILIISTINDLNNKHILAYARKHNDTDLLNYLITLGVTS